MVIRPVVLRVIRQRPSAGRLTHSDIPMDCPPPEMFSTTTLPPSCALPSARVKVSVAPPAEEGTIHVITPPG